MKKISLAIPMALLFAAFAEAQPASKASSKSRGDTSGLAQLQSQWSAAANAKDSARLTALYTDNATLLPSNAPMAKGRAAIEGVWKNLMAQSPHDIVLTPVDRWVSGDVAFEVGTYSVIYGAPGAAGTPDKGKYLYTARRGSDGKWLIQYDIFNSDLPCAGPVR